MTVKSVKESCLLCGETPRFWEDIVVVREKLQHPVQISRKEIFSADFKHSRKVLESEILMKKLSLDHESSKSFHSIMKAQKDFTRS